MMRLRFFIVLFILSGFLTESGAQSRYRLTGPVQSGALTIYLIQTDSAQITRSYLTLDEAIRTQAATLRETGTTNLLIENRSDKDIFIQSGQIVKGGQQDRMLANDLIIPAGETNSQISAFCVEHDRSFQRGQEPLATFSQASELAPLPSMRSAATKPLAAHANALTPTNTGGNGYTAPADSAHRATPISQEQALLNQLQWYESQSVFQETAEQKQVQEEVWSGVKNVQQNLERRLGRSVQEKLSPSSLELSLEDSAVQLLFDSLSRSITESLAVQGSNASQSVGFAYTLNGRLHGFDLYGSHQLFKKQQSMLLRSALIESELITPENAQSLSASEVANEVNRSLRGERFEKDLSVREHVTLWQEGSVSRFETHDSSTPEAPIHVSELTPPN